MPIDASRAPLPSLSLVVAMYNRAGILPLLTAALARQRMGNAEVLFADDGSEPGTIAALHDAAAVLPYPARHLHHEDRGWRKNVMLNAAIRAARAEYLVFIDADCLPHHRFLEDHWSARMPQRVLCGRRIEMSPSWTSRLTVDRVMSGSFERVTPRVWWDGMRGAATRVEDGLRLPRPIARVLHGRARGMLGSNFSAWKRDLEAVNGFDEVYDGPGCGEDSDLEFRLSLLGVRPLPLRHLAVQVHLWHPRTVPPERCLQRFAEVRRRGTARCETGLDRPGADASITVTELRTRVASDM